MNSSASAVSTSRRPRSIRDRVQKAFAKLRRDGFAARTDLSCCAEHGHEVIKALYPNASGYAFFTVKDARALNADGNLRVNRLLTISFNTAKRQRFSSIEACGAAVVGALRAEGLSVFWSGKGSERIIIMAGGPVS